MHLIWDLHMGPLNVPTKFGPSGLSLQAAPGRNFYVVYVVKFGGRAQAHWVRGPAQFFCESLVDPYVCLIVSATHSDYFHNKKVKKVWFSPYSITIAKYIKYGGRAQAGGWGHWAQILAGSLIDPYASLIASASNSEHFSKTLTPLLNTVVYARKYRTRLQFFGVLSQQGLWNNILINF